MLGAITNLFKKTFGTKSDKDIKQLRPIVDDILEWEKKVEGLSNDDLRGKTADFKKRISDYIAEEQSKIDALKTQADDYSLAVDRKEKIYDEIDEIESDITEKIEEILEEIAPEAFAVIKETAKRFCKSDTVKVTANEFDKKLTLVRPHVTIEGSEAIWNTSWDAAGADIKWDMIHYNVQLIGGLVLHQGKIAEMATGEGKTLVASLPVYLNALPGRGVHVVTVNDYLAKRDSEWIGPLFEFHGLSVDCIDKHQPNSDKRRDAYNADVTYGTNNEFGFDYLRDNMSGNPDDLVQRKHNYAIIDEVDSVLIDEARTPLIISGPTPKGDIQEYSALKPRIERLVKAQRTYVTTALADAKKLLNLTSDDEASKKELDKKHKEGNMALLRAYRGLPKNKALIKYLSEPGIKVALQKTEGFYLQDNAKEMPKIDAELFFVIDEKNNQVELAEKGIDLISRDQEDKNFFVLPDVGAKIAEIEKSGASPQEQLKMKDELMRDYSVKVERVHAINQLLKAYTLFERDIEYVVMDNKVKIVDEQTGRIMDGRRYSDGLHQAIEAKENVKVEAATQTYATVTLQNYFRMYNKLSGMTGTAETEAGEFWEIYKLDCVVIPTNRPIARADMEDKVYKTAREKYAGVIEEIEVLRNAKRPVLVGTTSVEVSELLGKILKSKNIPHNVLNAKLHAKEAEVVAEAGVAGTVTIATNMAGRGTDIKLRDGVKDAGGLAIIGTERHDSRRVDRQLRGRSGRQGDPGSSQFFVSLEDPLMRMFGSERIAKLMDRMGLEEGEVIQHSMITKSIERAQKKVEENNFGIRKHLLEYDDVMNSQREVIYKKRRHALFEDRLEVDIANSLYDTCESIIQETQDMGDYEAFKMELIRVLAMESPFTEDQFLQKNVNDLSNDLYANALKAYENKKTFINQVAFPVIKDVFENQSDKYQNIVIEFTDGSKGLQIITNLEKAYNSQGKYLITSLEKYVSLAMIDDAWKDHLREMDDLRQSVQNARYEQKDPLLIYKFESFELFKKMIDKVNKEIISFLFKANLPGADPSRVRQAQEQRTDFSKVQTTKSAVPQQAAAQEAVRNQQQGERQKPQPVVADEKIGRNDPCPCGSGKKYKQCHGK